MILKLGLRFVFILLIVFIYAIYPVYGSCGIRLVFQSLFKPPVYNIRIRRVLELVQHLNFAF